MKNLTKIFISGTLALAMVFSSVTNIAAKTCHSVYGGGEVCDEGNLKVEKWVKNPSENSFVENIDSSSYVFKASEDVTFEIKISNNSNVALHYVVTKDTLPGYLDYVRAEFTNNSQDAEDTINYLSDSRVIEIKTRELLKDEVDTVRVYAKVKGIGDIPVGYTLQKNLVVGRSDEDNDSDEDSSSYYINREGEKKVLGASYPETGPFGVIPMTLEVIGFGVLGGFYIVKANKSKRNIA